MARLQCTNNSMSVLKRVSSLLHWTRIKDAGIAIRHSQGYTFFYTAGSRKGLVGVGIGWRWHKKEVVPKKNTRFCYRKICWGRQTEGKRPPKSAGIDNEASWSCKRRVTANFVQNKSIWVQNLKNQGFNFLDSGNLTFSHRRPLPAFSLVGFKALQSPDKIKKWWFWPPAGAF